MSASRSRILINNRFQLKFSLYITTWLFILSMVYPVIIYFIFDFFIHYAEKKVADSSVQLLVQLKGEILWYLVAFQAIFLVVTFLISLFVSHRIAGPLFKLKNYMSKAKEGKLQEHLKFRKNDHFPEMADEYNEMVNSLHGIMNENVETVSTAIARIDNALQTMDDRQSQAKSEIQQALSDLRAVRSKISI